jgi:hypothetical protein
MKQLFVYVVLLVSIIISTIFLVPNTFYEKNINSKQIELKPIQKTQVLLETGRLALKGWSRIPNYFEFNKTLINPVSSGLFSKEFNRLRYKKWEAIMFTSGKLILLFAPFDISYLGGYLLHYADLTETSPDIHSTWYKSFTDIANITDQCYENCTVYNHTHLSSQLSIKTLNMFKSTTNSKRLEIDYNDNENTNLQITADLLRDNDADSLVTLTPISDDGSLFYFNTKQNTIVPTGSLVLNNKKYNLSDFLVSYDSGRGVWPFKSGWIWANGNGRTTNNDVIGINIGHGFSHPTASQATEDCFYINNKLYKLPAMITEKPSKKNKLWRFRVSENTNQDNLTGNTCYIEFRTRKHKSIGFNMVIGKVSFDISYGIFTGVCKDSDKKEYLFENVYGILEDKMSIW